jgi:hypothetical protein
MLPKRMLMPWTRVERVPRIRMLRVLILTMAAYLLFLLVVLVVVVDVGGMYPLGWLYGWAGVSFGGLLFGYWLRQRRDEQFVATSNHKTAHRQYTSRMFLNLGVSEVPALVGFVICFSIDALLPYLIALPVTLYLMFRDGPSAGDVRRLQTMLDRRGDTYGLAEVLMEAPPGKAA